MTTRITLDEHDVEMLCDALHALYETRHDDESARRMMRLVGAFEYLRDAYHASGVQVHMRA
jgi:hypothetical protein